MDTQMKNTIPILSLLAFISCSQDETIAPIECIHKADINGIFVHVQIVSELPTFEICITNNAVKRCKLVKKHFYKCINFKKEDCDIITFEDGCEIYLN
jgi:hypothetical protein